MFFENGGEVAYYLGISLKVNLFKFRLLKIL